MFSYLTEVTARCVTKLRRRPAQRCSARVKTNLDVTLKKLLSSKNIVNLKMCENYH